MKASDSLFLVGIVLAIAGAGSGAFLLLGIGGLVFVVGIVVRALTKGAAEADENDSASDTDA